VGIHAGRCPYQSSIDGGDGVITLILGLGIAAGGAAVGTRNGRLWVSIVAAVFAAFTVLTAVVDMNDVHEGVSIGSGLWLTLIAGIGAFAIAVAAIFTRALR
jgi:hypothetical protein